MELGSVIEIKINIFFESNFIFIMGSQQPVIQERMHSPEYLAAKIEENLSQARLNLSHKANIWEICRYLKQNYKSWEITQLHLQYDMVAGEVIEEITKINFQKAEKPLRVLALSSRHNDIQCDNLKYFRGAFFNSILMLYLDNNKIGSDGCFYLSKTSFQKLQTLDLHNNLINDKGAGHLAECNLPRLLNLNLSKNQLTYSGLIQLTKAHWPTLGFLQIKENSFEPTKQMQTLHFRTEVKMFRLQLQ